MKNVNEGIACAGGVIKKQDTFIRDLDFPKFKLNAYMHSLRTSKLMS